MLDAQTLRRVLHDFFRFNPKDFYVRASPTGFLVGINKVASDFTPSTPWLVSPVSPPKGQEKTHGWVSVENYSTICQTLDPSSDIDVTGLNSPVQMDIDTQPRQMIWADIDLTPLQVKPTPGPATGSIKTGNTWNVVTSGMPLDIFPSIFQFNTDNGTPEGSGMGDPPPNLQQTHLIIPLAYTYDPDDNPWGTFEPESVTMTTADSTVELVQVCFNHMRLANDCDDDSGQPVKIYLPPTASIPPNFDDD